MDSSFSPESRKSSLFVAKLAKECERYSDMKNYMHKHVMMVFSANKQEGNDQEIAVAAELTEEEREFLSVAYKESIAPLRLALKSLEKLKQKGCLKSRFVEGENEFKAKLKTQISDLCNEMMGLLDTYYLIPSCSVESKVFCLQMKMDFHGYLAEIKEEEERKKEIEIAKQSYKEAKTIANNSDLLLCDPARLSLEISFSLFTYEILEEKEKAIKLSLQAYNGAYSDLRDLDEDSLAKYDKVWPLLATLNNNFMTWDPLE